MANKKGSLEVNINMTNEKLLKDLKTVEKQAKAQTTRLKQVMARKDKLENEFMGRKEIDRREKEEKISKKRRATHKENVEEYHRQGMTFKEGHGPSMKNAIGTANSIFNQGQALLDNLAKQTDWDEKKARDHVQAAFSTTDLKGLSWHKSASANPAEQVAGFNEKYSGGIAQMPALVKHAAKMEDAKNPLARVDESIANTVDAIKNFNKSFITSIYDIEDGIRVFDRTVMEFSFETKDAMHKTRKYLNSLGFDAEIGPGGGLQVQAEANKDPEAQRSWAKKLALSLGVPTQAIYGRKEKVAGPKPTLNGMPIIPAQVAELGRVGTLAAGGKEGFDMESRAVKDLFRRTGLKKDYKREIMSSTTDEGLSEWLDKSEENDRMVRRLGKALGVKPGEEEKPPTWKETYMAENPIKGSLRFTKMFEGGGMGKAEDIFKGGMEGAVGAFTGAREGGAGIMKSMGAGAKGGMSGAMGAAGGPAGIIVMAIQKIGEVIQEGVEIMKKIWEFMVQSSPQLRATIKLIMRGLMLFMRPFGDLIAIVMRPMARWLIRLNSAAMKAGKAAGKPGSPEYLQAYMKSWKEGFMGGVIENVMKPLFTVIKELLPPFIETLVPILVVLVAAITPAIISGIVMSIGQIFADFGNWMAGGLFNIGYNILLGIGKAVLALGGAISSTIDAFGSAMGSTWDWIWGGIVDAFTGLWDTIKRIPEFFWNMLTGAFGGLWEKISGFGKWLWDTITGAFTGALKGIGGGIQSAKDWLGLAEGGIVTGPTHALIGEHGPEAVIPLSKGGLGGTSVTLNWNQSGAIYGVDDLEKTVQHALDQYFRKAVTSR